MRYLFQQMLAFWSIIIIILVVVGVSFTQFTRQTMLENNYQQMLGYAESIQSNSVHQPDLLLQNITLTEHALKAQNVSFLFIDESKTVTYPEAVQGTDPGQLITEKSWEKLKNGEVVKTVLEQNINEGMKQRFAIVFQPLFTKNLVDGEENFFGTIAVMQPISNIETSLRTLTENLFKGFLISSIIALILSYLIAKFQVNRINRMKGATRQIAEGNFDVNLEIKGNDELDELALDFNKMADALRESNEEVNRQEDRRRQFMADAAHEMRTPLTTINGLLEGLAYKAIPADQEDKCIQLMRNETTRLIRLVNENLDYEKIRTNQISMVIQKFNATETVQQVVEQLSARAKESGNKLVLLPSEDGLDVEISADYDRFVQVLVNIIQNAIQFTLDGEITVALERGYLETKVSVSDTGVGMSDEEVANIWERYYKVDPSRKNTKYGESGLGLSIVHQLVKLHNGQIDVTSEKNVGTTFTIIFPDKETTTEALES